MNDTLTVDQALDFVQSLLDKQGKKMNDNDRNIFKGIWIGETNEQLATRLGLPIENAKNIENIDKHYVYHLVRLLKPVLGEDLRRNNLKEVVQKEWNKQKLKLGIYVERPPLEKECYEEIEQPLGGMIRIEAPQKMGKSTLVLKIFCKYASDPQQKYLTVELDFQRALTEDFSNYDKFLEWFFRNISQNLKRQNVDGFDDFPSDALNEYCYFEDNILKKINNKILVLALKKLDRVFPLDFAVDFLSLLRCWYNDGRNHPNFDKLKLILSYSEKCQVQFPKGLSPFNVGHRAELREFNKSEIINFAEQHHIDLNNNYIEKIMLQVGGHPYLIRQIIRKLKTESTQEKEDFEKVISSSLTEEFFNQHLDEDIWDKLQSIRYQNSETIYNLTMTNLKSLLEKQQVVKEYDEDSEKIYWLLDSLGLVKTDRDETKQEVIKFRNNLYREYLRNKLLRR